MSNYLKVVLVVLVQILIFSDALCAKKIFPEYQHFTLPNGLEVYFSPSKLKPNQFHARILVKSGAKHEPADATGLAHYLEHVLFFGTQRIGTINWGAEKKLQDQIEALYTKRAAISDPDARQRLDQRINELTLQTTKYCNPNEFNELYNYFGAERKNAFTHHDWTNYIVTLGKNRLEDWALLEFERFTNPVFRMFQPELEVVFEEMEKRSNNPYFTTQDSLRKAMFANHPYSRYVASLPQHIKNPNLVKMRNFFNTYYVPNNMAIIISGDLEFKEVKRVVTAKFSSLTSRKVPKYQKVEVKSPQRVIKKTVKYPSKPGVTVAYLLPGSGSSDLEALILLDMILANQQAGLIDINLVQKQRIKNGGSFQTFKVDYGNQFLHGEANPGQSLEDVAKLLVAQLEPVKKGRFSDELLAAIKLDKQKREMKWLEENENRAGMLQGAIISGKWGNDYDAVTREDIVRVANKYFGNNYAVVYRQIGEYTPPKFKKPQVKKIQQFVQQRSPAFMEIVTRKVAPLQPRFLDIPNVIVRSKVKEGIELYYQKNPVNDLAFLEVHFAYGCFNDKARCHFIDILKKLGTRDMPPSELSNKLYNLGITYRFTESLFKIRLEISGPDKNILEGFELAINVLKEPFIEDEFLSKSVASIIKNRNDITKNPRTINKAIAWYVSRGKYSGYKYVSTNQQLKKLSSKDYPSFAHNLFSSPKKIYYLGNIPIDDLKKKLKKQFDSPVVEFAQVPAIKVKTVQRPTIYFYDLPASKQADVNVILGTSDLSSVKDRLNKILFYLYYSNSSILSEEIRTRRSLAYSVSSGFAYGYRPIDQDYLEGGLSTQPEKIVEAVNVFHNLFDEVPIIPPKFEVAVRGLENKYRLQADPFRRVLSLVERFERWGYVGFDPRKQIFDYINTGGVSINDFKQFAVDRVEKKNLIFTIVGDSRRLDLATLQQRYDFVELSTDDLFGF